MINWIPLYCYCTLYDYLGFFIICYGEYDEPWFVACSNLSSECREKKNGVKFPANEARSDLDEEGRLNI